MKANSDFRIKGLKVKIPYYCILLQYFITPPNYKIKMLDCLGNKQLKILKRKINLLLFNFRSKRLKFAPIFQNLVQNILSI